MAAPKREERSPIADRASTAPRGTRRRFLEAAGASAAMLGGLPATALGGRRRRPDGPNVVLIIVDTLRADHVFGPRARTPNIDALARDGLRFTRFYPEAMPTVPARRSFMSGQRAFPFRGWRPHPDLLTEPGWEPLRDISTSFTSVLRRAGYWTAYVTDTPPLGFSDSWRGFRRSFDRFVRRGGQLGGRSSGVSARELRHWLPPALDDPVTRDRVLRYLANGRYSRDETRSFAARVVRSGIEALEAGARRRPFCLVLDTFEPHEPWTPPRRYIDMYGDPDYRGPEPAKPYYSPLSRYLTDREREALVPRMRALYAAEVTMTDRWLGVFFDRLHELRLDRETIVVLTADHGFYVGEHGLSGKSMHRLHPELIHVPLIVVDPEGRRAGRKSGYLAQSHDVAPTILSMAGVRAPRKMDGVDLSRLFRGGRPRERRYSYGGYGNSFFVRTDRWAMYGDNRGRELHLSNPRRDRNWSRDLAGSRSERAGRLFRAVRVRAGGRLPYFPNF